MEKIDWIIGLLVGIIILQGVLVHRLTAAVGCLRTLLVDRDRTRDVLDRIQRNTLTTATAAIYSSSYFMQQRRIEECVGREYLE